MLYKSLSQFYTGSEWRKLREMLMNERVNAQGEIICEECGEPIIRAYDCIGHHKIELTMQNVNDYAVSLNPENIALVHMTCHNIIHKRFGGRVQSWQRKVYYIYGSPCSGKSTFVRENMQRGDLVLDIDQLWCAISGQPEYDKPNELKTPVFMARDAVLDAVKTRAGRWQQAFVIEGGALLGDRMRRIDALGAEAIHIDTPREECIRRLANDESRRHVQEQWVEHINKWWDSYQPDKI